MRLYFSGVSDATTAAMLKSAGVQRVLVDPLDIPNADPFPEIALDSGAYRIWKKGGQLCLPDYLELASGGWAFSVAADVIGDAGATWKNWELCRQVKGMIPVWHWGSDRALLDKYLADAPVIAIGALVPLMRAKDKQMLRDLSALCREYPNRFHLLGVNWLKAIEECGPFAASGDTSKFLDGARYGHVLFVNSRTGHLSQCPAKVADGFLGSGQWDRFTRCAHNAQVLREYTEN